MLQAKHCCDILQEHQDALHAAGGHVYVDVPEGVRLVHCHLPVPQYPVIEDRKAAFVLLSIIRASSGRVTMSYSRDIPSMWFEASISPVTWITRLKS